MEANSDFYCNSATHFSAIAGNGRLPTTISVDKVDPRGGYTPDNVVLCAARINSMKNDVTLEEMREWMPKWYERVIAEVRTGRLIIQDADF